MSKQLLIHFFLTHDDTLRSDDDEVKCPGGRDAMNSIRQSLAECGHITSEVTQRSFYGWEFTLKADGRKILVVISNPDEWVISLSQLGFLNFLFAKMSLESTLCRLRESITKILSDCGLGDDIRLTEEPGWPSF